MTARERIDALDFVRGIAILGILLANIVAFSQQRLAYYWPPALPGGANEADGLIWLAQYVLVDGKMRGLFALLFGAGLVLFMERQPVFEKGIVLQARRLFWLGLFGMLHYTFLFDGDILFMYAAAGFVAVLGLQAQPRTLLVVGIGWLLGAGLLYAFELAAPAWIEFQTAADPAHPARMALEDYWQGRLADSTAEAQVYAHGSYAEIVWLRASAGVDEAMRLVTLNFYETIPLMLIGMGLFKAGVFTDAELRVRLRKAAWGGVLVGAGLLALVGLGLWARDFPPFQTQFAFFGVTLLVNLPFLLGATVLLADWSVKIHDSWLGERLRQAGRMAFSNYIGTSLVMMLIFQGWAGASFGEYHRLELLMFVVLGWALMLNFSRLWLARFRYGPLEWLWRCLTYWRLFPIRR